MIRNAFFVVSVSFCVLCSELVILCKQELSTMGKKGNREVEIVLKVR